MSEPTRIGDVAGDLFSAAGAAEQPDLAVGVEPQRFAISVPGDPLPWPRSAARVAPGKPGRGFRGKIPGYVWKPWINFYMPTPQKQRARAIRDEWRAAGFGRWPEHVPLSLGVIAVFARPTGHFGTGRNAGTVKSQHLWKRPGGRGNENSDGQRTGGDLDNVVKLVADALNGFAYADDGQIAMLDRCEKLFCDQAGVDAPCTLIELRTL